MQSCAAASSQIWQVMRHEKLKVTVLGAGNWGTVVGKIVASNTFECNLFHNDVNIWLYDEKVQGRNLSEIMNTDHENPKYLPNIKLPHNLIAVPDMEQACKNSRLFVFVIPCQFLKNICDQLKAKKLIGPNDYCISLTKGIFLEETHCNLCTKVIEKYFKCSACCLSGANIATDVGLENPSEATIGYKSWDIGQMWLQLFDTNYFKINLVPDISTVEALGGLKNILAMASGFCDGLKCGANTRAALIRIGFLEMKLFICSFFDDSLEETFWESCGIADVIATCGDGRNARCAAEYIKRGGRDSWDQLEAELLNGQKLQGIVTIKEIMPLLKNYGLLNKFPLFHSIYQVARGELEIDKWLNKFWSKDLNVQYPQAHYTQVRTSCQIREIKDKIASIALT